MSHRWLATLWVCLRSFRGCLVWLVLALCGLGCASESRPAWTADDCAEVGYVGGVEGHPLRLSNATQVSLGAHPFLPLGEEVPWFADSQHEVEARTQKNLIGQSIPIRSPAFGGATPQCPSNPVLSTQEALEKEAYDAGDGVGQQFGEAIGRVESGIKMMQAWPHSGLSLKRILNNPDERDALMRSFAADLDHVPELPTYTDPALARAALAGFQTGYQAGMDAAHRRAWLVNATVDVFFMVVGNIAGALESAGAKLLDTAIQRLRGMPIFVPGTVGGAGFFMRAGSLVKSSSRRLLAAMREAGKKPLDGEVPHHIAASADPRAADARKILAKFDVGLDEAANGVFLPSNMKAPNPKGKAVHSKVHTDAYYQTLTELLKGAKSKEDVIKILEGIATKLEQGGL